MEEFNVEVELIARDELDKPDATFSGFVYRADGSSKYRYLTLGFSTKFGDAMVDLLMEHYYVTSIFWSPNKNSSIDKVGFDTNPEDQNEAFETLQELLEYDQANFKCSEREDEMETSVSSPKRMEVMLTQKKNPIVKRRVIVTQILPATNSFKYCTLSGRIQTLSTGKYERQVSSGMNSHEWNIVQIDTCGSGRTYSSAIFFDQGVRQEEAWERVISFYEGVTPAERKLIEDWEAPGPRYTRFEDDDPYEFYGGNSSVYPNYYDRVPAAYAPALAALRTAGDEIGAQLYLTQTEKQTQHLEESQKLDIRAYLDAKDFEKSAEEAAKQENTSFLPTLFAPKTNSSRRCECGSLVCQGCVKKGGQPEAQQDSVPGYVPLSERQPKYLVH